MNYEFDNDNFPGEKLPPQRIISEAIKHNCPSISYSYTEPTIFFEYAYDTMKLAHKAGLKNIWVSNGYFSDQVFEKIKELLDAVNVDLKSFSNEFYQKQCGARLQPILKNLEKIAKSKIHLEVTTLVIPGQNDSEKELSQIAEFIADRLSPEVPWHLSRFFPAYKMADTPPTPLKTLEKAEKIGKRAGLKYIHLGNI